MLPPRSLILLARPPIRSRAEGCCGPTTPGAARMAAFLDNSGVERLWLPGYKVEWDTGAPVHAWPTTHRHTHCSASPPAWRCASASICCARPSTADPARQRPDGLAANPGRRGAGLVGDARRDRGPDAGQPGRPRGRGVREPEPRQPGHISIVRPSDIAVPDLLEHGPFTTQAGGHNWLSAPLQLGFAGHRSAWHPGGTGAVRFFAHPVDWSSVKA